MKSVLFAFALGTLAILSALLGYEIVEGRQERRALDLLQGQERSFEVVAQQRSESGIRWITVRVGSENKTTHTLMLLPETCVTWEFKSPRECLDSLPPSFYVNSLSWHDGLLGPQIRLVSILHPPSPEAK